MCNDFDAISTFYDSVLQLIETQTQPFFLTPGAEQAAQAARGMAFHRRSLPARAKALDSSKISKKIVYIHFAIPPRLPDEKSPTPTRRHSTRTPRDAAPREN